MFRFILLVVNSDRRESVHSKLLRPVHLIELGCLRESPQCLSVQLLPPAAFFSSDRNFSP